ncbi:MAG: tetratricopeptide repeat protein [bacterium]
MRLTQKVLLFCLIFIIGIFFGVGSTIIITKQTRRNIGEIYWQTISESRKLSNPMAIVRIKKFINKYPGSDYVEDAYYQICKIKFKECANTDKNWDKPLKAYLKLLNDYPNSKYLESISFFIPFCYAKNKDYPAAIVRFKKFLKMFPNSDMADEAQYNIGRLYWACGKFGKAKQAYKLVVKNYPDEDLVDEGLFRIGEVYLSQGNYQRAISQFQRVTKKFFKGKITPYSQAMIGFCLYLQRQNDKAKDEFLKILSNYPYTTLKNDVLEFIRKMSPQIRIIQNENQPKTYFLCLDKGIIYNNKDSLVLINLTKEDVNNMDIFPFNTKMFFSPGGNEFIVGSGDYLWRVGIDGVKKTKLVKQQGVKVNIHWSFDRKGIIYETEDTLFLIQDNKLTKLLVKSLSAGSFSPVWSYDSTKFVCLDWSKDGSVADLVIFDSNGNAGKRINKIFDKQIRFSTSQGFRWSKDSNKIAYGITRKWVRGISEEVKIVDVQRGMVHTVVYDSARDICWSPDSSKIAYSNYRGTSIIDANGKNWQHLSNIIPGCLQWKSNQSLCGITKRKDFFIYRVLDLKGKIKQVIYKGYNPLPNGKLIAYNDSKGRLFLGDKLLSYSKVTPLKWLDSKILCYDSKSYFIINNTRKQQVYQGTPIEILASFKGLIFVPKSYDEVSIFGNLGGNIARLKDKTPYLLTLKGGKNPVLSRNKKYLAYENADNIYVMSTDGTNKFQLTLLGGCCPNWFEDRIIFEQYEKTSLNWWNFHLKINQKIHQEKGKIANEYLLDLIQPTDFKENIGIINKDGTNYVQLINHGKNPNISITGKIAFERNDMLWIKDVNEEGESKLVKGSRPKWSCDGQILAYLKNGNLWIMDKKEKKLEDLIDDFNWLPFKNKIAYSKNGALFIKDVVTDKIVQLTRKG